jgi:hypothetical protein
MTQREIVLEQIEKLSKEYSSKKAPNHFLVTTRATGYRHQILAGADFSLFTLQALSPQQQKDMLCRYYQHWNKNISLPSGAFDTQQFADDLFMQLSTNSGLIRLRNSPLMLSQIALTHYRGEKIPAVRSELYERCVLELVQRHAGHGSKASDTLLKQDYDRLVLLGGIAFLLHQRKKTDFVTLEEIRAILKLLKGTYPNLDIADEQAPSIIASVEQDWGILTSFRDELGQKVYKFSNLSFQEYLVARLIHESPRQKEYWDVLSKGDYFRKDWDWWCEVALLYSGLPVQKILPADKMIEEILKNINLQNKSQTWVNAAYCLVSSRDAQKVRRRVEIIDHLKSQVEEFRHPDSENALEALIQIIPDGLKYTVDSITDKDTHLMLHSDDFFDLLFKINEPLSRQILRDALIAVLEHNSKYIQEPRELELIHIATALSIIGDTRLGQLCKVTGKNITYRPFMIGQYPVTNAEYSNFLEETKRIFPSHWGGTKPLELANHPVTNISLDDANDYCKWLSEKLHKKYRLPTEKEWMFMARDGQYERTWTYPWLGDLRIDYLNCRSRYVGSTKTTPVGLYKDGCTPDFGIYDLLGNVWEWTSSRRGGGYATKGMAWDTVDASAGVNAVEYVAPHEKRDNLGFRILQEI